MAEIEETVLIAAARGLTHAGLWDLGRKLLAATTSNDPPSVALARADIELQTGFFLRTHHAGPALAAAAEAVASADPAFRWELELLRLRADYARHLFTDSGGFRDADEHSADVKAAFAKRVADLRGSAPAKARAGWAAFWGGVVSDYILGDPEAADSCYADALATGESEDDDLLVSYALRHLSARAEPDVARAYHERSKRIRQAEGFVPGVLAEQIELAELELTTGSRERGALLAEEVRDWSAALGITLLADYAGRLVDG